MRTLKVSSPRQLRNALADAESQDVVEITKSLRVSAHRGEGEARHCFDIATDDITVRGARTEYCPVITLGQDLDLPDRVDRMALFKIGGSNVKVQNLRFRNESREGIIMTGLSFRKASGSVVSGCRFDGDWSRCINLYRTKTVAIEDSTFIDTNGHGVRVRRTSHAMVKRCFFRTRNHAITSGPNEGSSYDAIENNIVMVAPSHYAIEAHGTNDCEDPVYQVLNIADDASFPEMNENPVQTDPDENIGVGGLAGQEFNIKGNRIFVADGVGRKRTKAIWIRGEPRVHCHIENNILPYDGIIGLHGPSLGRAKHKFVVRGNSRQHA